MRKTIIAASLLLGLILFVLLVRLPHAELVEHHGLQVEADTATDCIVCHDGMVGSNVSYCTVDCGLSNHAVLTAYPPPGKEREFTTAETLTAKGIKLENGQVTCISCHNLRNTQQYHLAMETNGSALCYACHIK